MAQKLGRIVGPKGEDGKRATIGRIEMGNYGPRLSLATRDEGVWYNLTSMTFTSKEGEVRTVDGIRWPLDAYLEDNVTITVEPEDEDF